MDKGQFLIETHLRTGRSIKELAAAHGVSESWLFKLLRRYRLEGPEGLEPRSRRPKTTPTRIADLYEDEIVRRRKELVDGGFDAGLRPSTSTWPPRDDRSLGLDHPPGPRRPRLRHPRTAQATQELVEALRRRVPQRVLAGRRHPRRSRRRCGLRGPQRDRRPLEALCGQPGVRLTKGPDVVRTMHRAASTWGYPQRFLTDNGRIFTTPLGSGVGAMEIELLSLGIATTHGRPYHPQTQGKVERFHQTLKKYLAKQEPATTKKLLQGQLNRFLEYYNTERPHRGIGRRRPIEAFGAREKVGPIGPRIEAAGYRIRHDKVDRGGSVTLRYKGKLHHIGVGCPYAGWRVILLVAGLDVRVIGLDGSPLRHLTLDPSVDYQRIP